MSKKSTPALARREFLATGSRLSLAASLGGLGLSVASLDARAATSITFMTPFGYLIGFAPVLWAVTGGHFEKEGLKVDVQGGKVLTGPEIISDDIDISETSKSANLS